MDLSRLDLSALRYLTNAAAGLPVEHVKRLRETFPRVELYLMHGLTEVARTMYLPPDQTDIRPASSGIAMPGTELWVEDEEGRRLGPGEVGELVVRGQTRHARLLEGARIDGAAVPARAAAWGTGLLQRGPVPHGRGRLLLLRQPEGRHHQEPGRKGRAPGSRERALHHPRRAGCGGDWRSRPAPGAGRSRPLLSLPGRS